eukprot:2381014-Pleurochrysis_carterae.AAC.1
MSDGALSARETPTAVKPPRLLAPRRKEALALSPLTRNLSSPANALHTRLRLRESLPILPVPRPMHVLCAHVLVAQADAGAGARALAQGAAGAAARLPEQDRGARDPRRRRAAARGCPREGAAAPLAGGGGGAHVQDAVLHPERAHGAAHRRRPLDAQPARHAARLRLGHAHHRHVGQPRRPQHPRQPQGEAEGPAEQRRARCALSDG